jgi:NDP-sugar pyrophosphorylase family protein
MKNSISQALILCGGKGERLKPITNNIPKPLVKIGKEPILSHQIKYLRNQGIKKFIIATGYKSNQIEKFIELEFNNLDISIVDSGNVDILFRIKDCKSLIEKKFLLCYGDTLANIDLKKLNRFHNSHRGEVSVSSYQLQSQFGILKSNKDNLVIEFLEKPKLDAWINIGYFIFEKSTDLLKNNFADFIEYLAKSKKLYCYKHRGLHITVNTIKELKEAETNIKHFI